MTDSITLILQGERKRPPLSWLVVAFLLSALVAWFPRQASAHAEPERASPPISGVVETAPPIVEIWFSDEVNPAGTTIQVIGPGGIQVDLGDAAVDLQDAERKHVTVSLRTGLSDGVYSVQWRSISGTDGDEDQGEYIFTVGNAASPPAAIVATATPTPTVLPVRTPVPAQPVKKDNFDSGAFGISVIAGLVVAVLLYLFWRKVRPKHPSVRN